jgi:hypothetical protein
LGESDKLLTQANSSVNATVSNHEKSIGIACEFLNRLNVSVLKYSFRSTEEEIKFFKEIKPKFLANIIFHLNCLQIESGKPKADDTTLIKYFTRYSKLINQYNKTNKEFHTYYRSGATHLDNKYFKRGKKDPKILVDSYVFNFDERLSTTHEFKVAKLIAYERLAQYISIEVNKIRNAGIKRLTNKSGSSFTWTDSKVSLVELIYALYAAQSLNSGKIEIQDLANFFQQSFNIELGDFYRKYLEIKARKYNPTKFIDTLRDALVKKMEEELD